ncbi:MAG: TonB-dependent receptor [Acidobacteria bacterium]|nr:TonB-dependent receptor [Acidobacteriota bacterium]
MRVPRLLLCTLLTTSACMAQSATGELTGTVTDEQSSPIATTKVALRNTATGEAREVTTDTSGAYILSQLVPGEYQLTAEMQGFRRFVRNGVTIQVGQRARVDIQLSLGAVTESIEVTAETPLLDTSEASLGQAIENRKILELPLNGRNVVGLAALVTGVVPGTSFGIGVPDGRAALIQAATANLVVNGGMSAHNDVLVDGVPLSLCCQNQIAFIPSIDATQEFRVRTNLYDAEYGRTSGGVITYATRGGSNELHGSVFEFLRNRNLDANNFFSNRAGIARGHFVYNQFGGRVGGRIVRDKTFWFANYEGIENRRGAFLSGITPTAEEKTGQFAQNIFDPLGAAQSGTTFTRTPFPGNRIPASRLDPVAVKLSPLWPAPNTSGTNNFISNASATDKEKQLTGRIDHLFSPTHRFFGRHSYNHNDGLLPDWFGNIASPGVFAQQIRNQNGVLDDTLTLSSTRLVNIRYGFTRQSNVREPRSTGTDLTTYGWPAAFSAARQDTSLPRITPAGYFALSSNHLFERIAEVHALAGTVHEVRGRHSLKFGTDWRVYRANWVNNGTAAGQFAFNTGFTRGPNAQTGGGGNSFASFLLGNPASGNIIILEPSASPQLYHGLFLQDDIRVNSRLTINAGVRWDVETPRWERYNRLSYFNPAVASPLAGPAGIANLRGGLEFVGVNGHPRKQQDIDWNNIGPRFGLAYSITRKLALRAGYGITYLPTTSRYVNNSNQGFAATTTFFSSVDGINPVGVLRDPFPTGVLPPPGASGGLATSIGESFGTLLRHDPIGYSQQWSSNFQYELMPNLLIDAAYAGSKGTSLPVTLAMNQIDSSYLSQGATLLQQVANPFRTFSSPGPLTSATTTRLQMLRPFPQFIGLTNNQAGVGMSTYHSFQLKVNKRLSRGFSILGSYTTGKLLTDTVPSLVSFLDPAPGFQDAYNRKLDRAVATQDVAQRLVISYVWEVPVMRGDHPRVLKAALGGWQLNGITTFMSGQPLVLTNAVPTTSGATRPNNNGTSAKKTGRVHDRLTAYFNTAVFSAPGPFEFGSAPRTLPDVRSDGLRNFDLSLFKNFVVWEGATLQLRGEFFNVFNTVRFDAPSGAFGNAPFGSINAQENLPRNVQVALRFSF